jgi:hypothetical protein
VASWIILDEDDAVAVLDDIDSAVPEGWPGPNLSGQWADEPTPESLLHDLGLEPHLVAADHAEALCDAWQNAADEVFARALDAVALRTLGRIAEALEIERLLEQRASIR